MTPSTPTGVRVSDLSALLGRIEGAGADRELDAALCAYFRLLSPRAERERWAREWSGPIIAKGDRVYLSHADGRADGLSCDARLLTASLDAALALCARVLPGWFVGLQQNRHHNKPTDWTAYVERSTKNEHEATSPTPALALLAAMLKALIAATQDTSEGNDRTREGQS